jgi:hypothetical protein
VVVWLPDVQRNPGQDAGSFVGPVTIGLIHTVEGSSFTPGDDYYGNPYWPHFTFKPGDLSYAKAVWQHLPLDRAARALQNRSGGVETNREGVIQIEVVGFARDPSWSRGETPTVRNFRRLMRGIEANTRVPHRSVVRFGGNEQYGLENGYELTAAEWVAYEGWCGHQHAPENAHWDPGAIDIANLLEEPMALTDADADRVVDLLFDRLAKDSGRAVNARLAVSRDVAAFLSGDRAEAVEFRRQVALTVLVRTRSDLHYRPVTIPDDGVEEGVNAFTVLDRAVQTGFLNVSLSTDALEILRALAAALLPPAPPEPPAG